MYKLCKCLVIVLLISMVSCGGSGGGGSDSEPAADADTIAASMWADFLSGLGGTTIESAVLDEEAFSGSTTIQTQSRTKECTGSSVSLELDFAMNSEAASISYIYLLFATPYISQLTPSDTAVSVLNDEISIDFDVTLNLNTQIRYLLIYGLADLQGAETDMVNADTEAATATEALEYLSALDSATDDTYEEAFNAALSFYTENSDHFYAAAENLTISLDPSPYVTDGESNWMLGWGFTGDCEFPVSE